VTWTLIILTLAVSITRLPVSSGIEAWAARTVRDSEPLAVRHLPFTPRPDTLAILSPPRLCAQRETSTLWLASPAWNELVREVTGRPGLDQWAEAYYPSGQAVAL
jgi:hypothetical protein